MAFAARLPFAVSDVFLTAHGSSGPGERRRNRGLYWYGLGVVYAIETSQLHVFTAEYEPEGGRPGPSNHLRAVFSCSPSAPAERKNPYDDPASS